MDSLRRSGPGAGPRVGARRVCRGAALLVSLSLASCSARADDSQLWLAAAVNGPVRADSRLLAGVDVQARYRDNGTELDVAAIRPAIGWHFRDRVDAYVGYAYVTQRRAGTDVVEHRAWEQVGYPLGGWLGGTLSGRTRLEQRTRRGASDTGWRFRQTFRYQRPIAASPRFGLVLWDEVAAGLNDADWGQRRGFEQNRAFVGTYWRVTRPLKVEAGYLNQRIHGHDGAADRTNHVLSLTVLMSP